jgi:hypothetical protein
MYNIISAIAALFQKPQDKKVAATTQTEGMYCMAQAELRITSR